MSGPDCPTCGRRRTETPVKLLLAWSESGLHACPRCITKALESPTGRSSNTPRCGGCGKRTTALSADQHRRCADCAEVGTVPLSLFEEV